MCKWVSSLVAWLGISPFSFRPSVEQHQVKLAPHFNFHGFYNNYNFFLSQQNIYTIIIIAQLVKIMMDQSTK